ncbi:MAG: glycosyltransferase [Bacteroidales bacterium]|jgi:hypothetical protein|nr:glycosyltransferase [Bacteroidales bacterium]
MHAYFFSKNPNPEYACHWLVSLAEGFSELGISSYGNRNIALLANGNGFLIKYEEGFSHKEADFLIFGAESYKDNDDMDQVIQQIVKSKNKKCVSIFIDSFDGVRTPGFSKGAQSCDIVLKCHYNKKYKYPKNFYPWQFGVTNRILDSIHPLSFEDKKKQLLLNFRTKHQLRDYMNELLLPIYGQYMEINTTTETFSAEGFGEKDLLYYKQTKGRHFPQYYDRLSESQYCAAYGGVFAIPWGNYSKYTAFIARKINEIIPLFKYDRVRQWDSWRLWEAWTAACCTIHVDFEKYGCVLSVMPTNGVHYIGVNIGQPHKIEEILSDEKRVREIAENGRNFVLEHYTPKVVAQRLLELVSTYRDSH